MMKNRAVKMFLKNPEGSFLMQLRDDKPEISYPGYWELIGGAVESGESDLEAINREAKEELMNCTPTNIRKIGEVYREDFKYITAVFMGELDILESEIELGEGQRVEYFSLKDILKLKIPEYIRIFINKNREKLLI